MKKLMTILKWMFMGTTNNGGPMNGLIGCSCRKKKC